MYREIIFQWKDNHVSLNQWYSGKHWTTRVKLKDKWMDLIENQVGSDLFRNANTAFSKFKIPERAAAYAKSIKAGGEFSPDELVNALLARINEL